MDIGFIGTGNMGRHMAAQLVEAGHRLSVHDVRRSACEELIASGAQWADTPRDAASASSVTVTVLPGPREVEMVALGEDGIIAGTHPGDVYIDMSTSTPGVLQGIAEVAARAGVEVLDAPVSGGVRGARKGSLVVMVGGARGTFDRCEPLLRLMGSQVFHVGALGSGYVAKLVNNYMGMINGLASMEAMVLGVKAGVDAATLLDIVNAGTGASHMTKTLYPYLIFKRNFEPARFTIELGAKDLGLAVDLGRELDVRLPIGGLVASLLDAAVQSGDGAVDFSAYIKILERSAGVEVKV